MRARSWLCPIALVAVPIAACSSQESATQSGASASTSGSGGATSSGSGGAAQTSASAASGTGGATSTTGSGGGASGYPAGWLYTMGNTILVSDGKSGGTQWMGRGVNIDDIFLCGYNYTLWMMSPEKSLETIVTGLMADWKPTFVRISLSMDSYPKIESWTKNPDEYQKPMTEVINAIGANPNVHVLVTLRSDPSMIGQDQADGDPEATGLPSDSKTTPDANAFPTGTDATYVALVDTFAQAGFVMFGLTNEPGGNKLTDDQIGAAMNHAVGVIRAEEDKLKVPHHIVSVQGNGWTSSIGSYAKNPIAYDNVVYEVHGYPPDAGSYTYPNIPVIIGEYGTLTKATAPAFYDDVEAKKIPNLAWDFDPFSDCAPDLLEVNQSAMNLKPSSDWGAIVQAYLLAHP